MAWNASLRFPRALEGAAPPFPEFHSQDMWIEEFLQVCPSFPVCHQPFHEFALEIRDKWLSDGDCTSPGCLSLIYCSCLLLPILNFLISDITRCLFDELCLYSEIFERLGLSMCGSSGSKIKSWQGSAFLTELTSLPLSVDLIEQYCHQNHYFIYD